MKERDQLVYCNPKCMQARGRDTAFTCIDDSFQEAHSQLGKDTKENITRRQHRKRQKRNLQELFQPRSKTLQMLSIVGHDSSLAYIS